MRLPSFKPVACLVAALPLPGAAQTAPAQTVVIQGSRLPAAPVLGATPLDSARLAARRGAGSDSARLLQDLPGLSLNGAGALSSLPAIHGLADERLRIQVDGMDLMAACPNHMNSALSYIAPQQVGSVTVFAGITPVSVGGDSLGGSVLVKSEEPEFAGEGEPGFARAQAGAFYRSNARARGHSLSARWVGPGLSLVLSGPSSQADNLRAGGAFKPASAGREGGPLLPGDEVGSSAYRGARNLDLALALRHGAHLLQVAVGEQRVGFEGFPNQRMDMTDNRNVVARLHYSTRQPWGELEAKAFGQETRHRMDMGPDRYSYGLGMPMLTQASTRGLSVQANLPLAEADVLRLGLQYQNHTLYDWWPAVGGTMGPNAFWNIDYGQRDKADAFAEWETPLASHWLGQLGVRGTRVRSNAAVVQGYDNGLAALWGNDAAAFNASNRRRNDQNWDVTALARYLPGPTRRYELGLARKSRAPSLYERYPWSTQAMAALMNNFVGDGNGYVGNVDLRSEVAHTLSATGQWQSAESAPGPAWRLSATAYHTQVQGFVDARRCQVGQCSLANAQLRDGFVLLQYVNQSARLRGLDLSGQLQLAGDGPLAGVRLAGQFNLVRGRNRSTGDPLYNLMPANGKLALEHRGAAWTHTLEWQAVAAKTRVSGVRNEIPTGAYQLLNLRSRFEWKNGRIDLAVENALNRRYSLPTGGAYLGQGASMTSNGIPWGVAVPGPGRSIDLALNLSY